MIVKTKKYQLPTTTFIKIGMLNIAKEFWWAWLIPVGILLIPILYRPALWWCVSIALIATILYVLFWLIQFAGVTQHQQFKVFFDKLLYEIDSRQLLIKVDAQHGMPIPWDKIQKVTKGKDHFLFVLSKVQFIYLPFSIFKTEQDIKFLETILKRKNFIKEKEKPEDPKKTEPAAKA